jgi:hypothetical protein
MEARGIGRAEENAGATPDLANVSLVASKSAAALTEAINAQYILYAMAHTIVGYRAALQRRLGPAFGAGKRIVNYWLR